MLRDVAASCWDVHSTSPVMLLRWIDAKYMLEYEKDLLCRMHIMRGSRDTFCSGLYTYKIKD